MSVETNQDELIELREEATDLGIKFQNSWKAATLQKKIDEKLSEIAEQQAESKAKKVSKKDVEKITVVIEAREGDEGIQDQFFSIGSMSTGYSEDILIMFGEKVEISKPMYDHIKSIGKNIKKFKMVTDDDGIPRKQWYDKWVTRFIVEKID